MHTCFNTNGDTIVLEFRLIDIRILASNIGRRKPLARGSLRPQTFFDRGALLNRSFGGPRYFAQNLIDPCSKLNKSPSIIMPEWCW